MTLVTILEGGEGTDGGILSAGARVERPGSDTTRRYILLKSTFSADDDEGAVLRERIARLEEEKLQRERELANVRLQLGPEALKKLTQWRRRGMQSSPSPTRMRIRRRRIGACSEPRQQMAR